MFRAADFSNDAYWELAKNLNIENVGEALEDEGWERTELETSVYYRRQKGDGKAFSLHLPKPNEDAPVPMIFNAATNYAYYRDKPIEEVLDRWRALRYDHARFRIVTNEAEEGELSLENVRDLTQGVVAAITSATKDVENPSNAHKRVSSSAISELTKRARFGVTEKGSYVVNLFIPPEETKDEEYLPSAKKLLFRKGLEHLASTLDLVERTANESDEVFRTANEKERASANLLEAFLKTTFEGKADVEFSVDWSPLVAPTPGVPSRVLLRKELAPKLKALASALRPKEEETREFYAKVVALEDLGKSDDERPSGAVSFCIEDDAADYRADAMLSADDFQTACEAFYPRATVAFNARVVKIGGKATINEITKLRKIDTSSFE